MTSRFTKMLGTATVFALVAVSAFAQTPAPKPAAAPAAASNQGKVLMAEDGIQPVFDRALAAATQRSRELAG